MNILVVNGSPKGQYSITLQTVRYLQILYPQHTFCELHAGQRIRALENDFSDAAQKLQAAQLILFSYPVYTFLAPYQLHRFIELVKQHGVDIRGKFAAQISTSKHFYDITAHAYVRDNCMDLCLAYLGGLSADMDDLTLPAGQKQAREFFEHILWRAENGLAEPCAPAPAAAVLSTASVPEASGEKTGDVVIITDCEPENTALAAMIDRFRAVLSRAARVVNIREYPFAAGCLGCFNCAADGRCIHKDGFDTFLREQLQTAQAMVYAFSVKDHSMGARFKLFDDRQFCNGHRTVTMGMPVGYLVHGALSAEENLRTVITARAQVGGNFLAGIACDETDADASVDALAKTLEYALDTGYVPPANFWGVGGMKVFRDLIWQMQGMMRADHKFYKAHGQYDFPQKKWPRMLAMYAVGAMLASPKLKAKMGNAMNEGMLMPYKKVLDAARKAQQKALQDTDTSTV